MLRSDQVDLSVDVFTAASNHSSPKSQLATVQTHGSSSCHLINLGCDKGCRSITSPALQVQLSANHTVPEQSCSRFVTMSDAVGKDLAAGTVAGAAQLLVGHPFDTIKVKLQSQAVPRPGEAPRYRSAWDAVRQTVALEGAGGLYRGMGAPLATVAVLNAVLFTARGQMEVLLRDHPGVKLSVNQQIVAGAGAGAACAMLACPTELIKCRLQAQSALAATPSALAGSLGAGAAVQQYSGPLDVARHVVRSEGGVLGLFKGLTPTLMREVPGNAAMFGAYEATKQYLAGGEDTSELGRGSQLIAGGLAGATFWALVYPTDVVKSAIQVDDQRHPRYRGSVDAFRKVVAAEGVRGLYRGFGPAMARSVPANAACFLAYELVRERLG